MNDVSKVEEVMVRKGKDSTCTLALVWGAPFEHHKTRRDVSRQNE